MTRSAFVPITMGAAGAVSLPLDDFLVTHAAFPAGELLAMHVHARPSLAVMLEGSFDLRIAGRDYGCVPGSAVVEPAEERHANQLGNAGARVLVIQPDVRALARLGRCGALFDRVTWQPRGPAPGIARQIAAELGHPDAMTPIVVEGLVLEMLARLGRQDARRPPGAGGWLPRTQDILHARFRNPPTVAELAEEAGVRADSLARAFRRHFGVSLGVYVRRLRLDWAAERLRSGDDAISVVALEAGFADQSHFTRLFRAHTGETPAAYRKRTRDS